jgi:hypothetical protein
MWWIDTCARRASQRSGSSETYTQNTQQATHAPAMPSNPSPLLARISYDYRAQSQLGKRVAVRGQRQWIRTLLSAPLPRGAGLPHLGSSSDLANCIGRRRIFLFSWLCSSGVGAQTIPGPILRNSAGRSLTPLTVRRSIFSVCCAPLRTLVVGSGSGMEPGWDAGGMQVVGQCR